MSLINNFMGVQPLQSPAGAIYYIKNRYVERRMDRTAELHHMDFVSIILTRGGLSPRKNCANGLSVYKIIEENRFDHIYEPVAKLIGYVHFQTTISVRRQSKELSTVVGPSEPIPPLDQLDIADPNFHINLLKYFGVMDEEFEIFEDHGVLIGL